MNVNALTPKNPARDRLFCQRGNCSAIPLSVRSLSSSLTGSGNPLHWLPLRPHDKAAIDLAQLLDMDEEEEVVVEEEEEEAESH